MGWGWWLASGIVVVSIDIDTSLVMGDTHRRPNHPMEAAAFVSGGHGVMESTTGCEAVDPGSIPGAPSIHDTGEEPQ